MRLRDVKGVQEIIAISGMTDDPLWGRDIEKISEGHIVLFYARAGLVGKRKEAIAAIERVQAAVIVAAFHGEKAAGVSALVVHSPPGEPYMVDEFVSGLSRLTQVRCRACLYALVMKLD